MESVHARDIIIVPQRIDEEDVIFMQKIWLFYYVLTTIFDAQIIELLGTTINK